MTSPLRDEKIVSGTYRNGAKYISLTQGPTSRSLTCPNFQAGFSKRQYALNAFVNGGPRSAALPGGTYGYLVVPSPQPYRSDFTVTAWDPANPTSTGYRLGAKLDRFSSSQFMICEQEHANDVSSTTAGGTGKVTLGGYAPDNYPPLQQAHRWQPLLPPQLLRARQLPLHRRPRRTTHPQRRRLERTPLRHPEQVTTPPRPMLASPQAVLMPRQPCDLLK